MPTFHKTPSSYFYHFKEEVSAGKTCFGFSCPFQPMISLTSGQMSERINGWIERQMTVLDILRHSNLMTNSVVYVMRILRHQGSRLRTLTEDSNTSLASDPL